MSSRYERLINMTFDLANDNFSSVKELCKMYNVKARTIYGDIEILKKQAGFKFSYDRKSKRYRKIESNLNFDKLDLTDGEIFALTLGKELLSQYTGTVFEPILKNGINKIIQRLPEYVTLNINDLKSIVNFNPGAMVSLSRKLFLDIYKSSCSNQQMEITYYAPSTNESTTRIIDPYRVLDYRGTWYLVAFCNLRKALRLFALHRIKEHNILNLVFKPIYKSKLEPWLEEAFQLEHSEKEFKFKIEFLPEAAKYIIERQWHKSQVLTQKSNGSCILEFTASSVEEIKRWILSYGSLARVLEPIELITLIQTELNNMTLNYLNITVNQN